MCISTFLHFLSNIGSFGIFLFRFCKKQMQISDKDKVIMTICRRNSSSPSLYCTINVCIPLSLLYNQCLHPPLSVVYIPLSLYCTSKVYRDFNADPQTTNVWSAGRTRWLLHGPRVLRPCGLSWLRVGFGFWRRMDAHITWSQLKRTSDS